MANQWTKLKFVSDAVQRFSHPSEKFADSSVWKDKRYEICYTHNKTANLFGFKNISKYGYKVWQESGFYVEGENELMVRSALIRYAAGGFHLPRDKRETIQQAVKQGWLFSDIEQELNLDEIRKRSTVVQPVNFEPEVVLHDAETKEVIPEPVPELEKKPEITLEPVKKIRIVEEVPQFNIPIQIKNINDRFTIVMIIWGCIALLLAIVTIISVIITHSSDTGKSDNINNSTVISDETLLTTTPRPIFNSTDCNQANTRCSRCDYIYQDGFLQRKCLQCAGNFYLNSAFTGVFINQKPNFNFDFFLQSKIHRYL